MTNTNNGKRVFFGGDFSNGPRYGTVIADDGNWMKVQWDEGRASMQPSGVVKMPGWKVL